MRLSKVMFIFMLLLIGGVSTAAGREGRSVVIKRPLYGTIVVEKGDNLITMADVNGTVWKLKSNGRGLLIFSNSDGEIARGRQVANRVNMAWADGRPFMRINMGYRKIHVSWENTREYIDFKLNNKNINVSYEGKKIGRIKYYMHSGKILAKDSRGTTVAEMKNMEHASAMPGPFMIDELPKEMRYFLLFYMLHAGL